MKSKKQMALGMRLVMVGVPGDTAAILGAACFDQRRLSSRFYGPPILSEKAAVAATEEWLERQSGYSAKADRPVPAGAVNELVKSIFGRSS